MFDGHAGKQCAQAVREIFPRTLEAKLKAIEHPFTDLSDVFTEVYEEVDQQLSEFEYEGCTSTTALVWQVGGSVEMFKNNLF